MVSEGNSRTLYNQDGVGCSVFEGLQSSNDAAFSLATALETNYCRHRHRRPRRTHRKDLLEEGGRILWPSGFGMGAGGRIFLHVARSLDTYAHTCSSSELNGCLQWFKTIQYVLSQRLIKQGKFGEYPKGIDETEQILHCFVTEITTCSHYERTNNPSDTDKILHVFSGMNKLHSSYSSHPKQH